jgi:hypothetical protein
MTEKEKNDLLFESLLKVAVKQTFDKELSELPSEEELGEEYRPSEELDRRIKSIIDSSFSKQNKRRSIKKLTRIAACVFIFLGVSSFVLLSVEATRNVILNAFINVKEKYTEIQFKDSVKSDGIYRPAYLPEGFSETSNVSIGNAVILTYSNEAGEKIVFTQAPADTGSLAVDNENMTYTEIKVNGVYALLFIADENEFPNKLIWQKDIMVFDISTKINREELVKIAENISNN